MNPTIANHCQRERRSRSSRDGMRNKSPNVTGRPRAAGSRARRQATAKKPASNSSIKIVFPFMATPKRRRPSKTRQFADVHGIVHYMHRKVNGMHLLCERNCGLILIPCVTCIFLVPLIQFDHHLATAKMAGAMLVLSVILAGVAPPIAGPIDPVARVIL